MGGVYVSRSWLEVEIDIDWRRLRGIVLCRVRGHGSTDLLGDCGRCGADVLGLPRMERLAIAHRALNAHMAQHLEYSLRERATGA